MFHLAGALVDRDDGEHNAVFAQMLAVPDDQIFNYIRGRAGIDAYPARRHFAGFLRRSGIHFENIPILEQHGAVYHPAAGCQFGTLLQVAIVAVQRNEKFGPQQVDHQPELFLAAVPAHVNQTGGTIVVDHVGFTPAQMIDHPVNTLFISWDDARAEHHRVAALDSRVLMVIHRRPRERRHRLTLGSANEHQHFFRSIIANLPG